MAEELSQEEINHIAGAVVENAMEAARECKEKHPYDPESFFRCCLPIFSQGMTHRGTDPEAIKVAERFGLVFDGMMEDLYEFTVAKGSEEAKGITFVVKDLSQVESRLAEKLKEFGIEEGNPARKKHYSRPYLANWQYGGYSYVEEDPTKPESLWPYGMVDYVNPDEVIAIAEREGLLEISLAGGFWERLGYKGWGEKVSISETKSVLAKAKEHMQAPSSSNPPPIKARARILWARERSDERIKILKKLGLEQEPYWAQPWDKLPSSYKEAIAIHYSTTYTHLRTIEGSNPGEYVTIINPGKTTFKVGEVVSREAFEKENERVIRLDEKPAAGR